MNIPPSGFTVADVAKRFRVGRDKVRTWIKRGELTAVNTSNRRCRRPRFVILPDALNAFERSRSTAPVPKKVRARKQQHQIDFFPDV
jgi:excisionase family DNA binding protein